MPAGTFQLTIKHYLACCYSKIAGQLDSILAPLSADLTRASPVSTALSITPADSTPMSDPKNQHPTLSDLDSQHDELLRQVDDLNERVLKALADCQPPPRPVESGQQG